MTDSSLHRRRHAGPRSVIDATIVRAVRLPATMKLRATQLRLRKRLAWLPKLEHEPEIVPVAT